MIFSNKKVIGLDIGASTIKVAEMDVGRHGATLNGFALMQTPEESVGTGELKDPGAIQLAIQSLMAELKTKRKSICTGMWGTAVIVKKITIPKMDKKVIREQLRFEAEQYIPFDINNVSIAYHPLSGSMSQDTMDILLVAAQNELVQQYTTVVTAAGFKPAIIDVSGFALSNIFEMNYGKPKNELIGLMNFGTNITNFVAIQGGNVIFCRDIPVGGANYTNEMSKVLGMTYQEAEAMKINAINKGEIPDEMQKVIQSTHEAVNEEVRNSIEYMSASTGGAVPTRCFYTGGGARTHGLIESVSQSSGIAFEEMNPLQNIKVNSKRISPTYAQQILPFVSIAMGLGIRQVSDS